jgi:DNA-binding CsgD family transcriptional regulator
LERRFRTATDPLERASIADRLLPELVTSYETDRCLAILARVPLHIPDRALAVRILALRGVVAAMRGLDVDDVTRAVAQTAGLPESDVVVVLGRAMVAASLRKDALAAQRYALSALEIAERIGMHHTAARICATLYATHFHLTQDLGSALFWIERATLFAYHAGDLAVWRVTLLAQYELAVLFGRRDQALSLRQLLQRHPAAAQYTEETGSIVADTLLAFWEGDFRLSLSRLESVIDAGVSTADAVILRSLRALALAALGDDDAARREARRAIHLSSSYAGFEPVFLQFRRRIGRVLASYASILVGDRYDGRRALTARRTTGTDGGPIASFAAMLLRSETLDPGDPELRFVRGYVLAAVAAAERRRKAQPAILLSEVELDILRGLQSGLTNVQIAARRHVGRSAVDHRIPSLLQKLSAKTRIEAVARAQLLGLL